MWMTAAFLPADSQPKSIDLVWGLAATWRWVCIHHMNWVNSRNGTTPWWQHHKYRHGIIIIIIGDCSFRVRAPRAWTSLPAGVTAACLLNVFKRQLITFLFDKSFYITTYFNYVPCSRSHSACAILIIIDACVPPATLHKYTIVWPII